MVVRTTGWPVSERLTVSGAIVKLAGTALPVPTERYTRMPTRLTWTTPPPERGSERVSAQTTPYCSPGGASRGTTMVTLPVRTSPEAMADEVGATDVQLDKGFDVCPAETKNAPLSIDAA